MAKSTLVLCDVKPCTCQAEREFEVNGQPVYVCGEQCFTKFWSREYGNWKQRPYKTQIVFHHPISMKEYVAQKVSERRYGNETFRSDLQIVKSQKVNEPGN